MNSSASLQVAAVDCVFGWPQRTVESAFRMADRQGKLYGLIQQPLTKGKTSCGGVKVSLHASGGGACWR
uniref:Uncharacterized protein n=1 Tax=Leersia perrieri TaxID=77586 RepID=A0A0D9XS03_9ORYZ